jgi:hypothetical protein
MSREALIYVGSGWATLAGTAAFQPQQGTHCRLLTYHRLGTVRLTPRKSPFSNAPGGLPGPENVTIRSPAANPMNIGIARRHRCLKALIRRKFLPTRNVKL